MASRLANKRAIVTGGASGIGEASVRRFVSEGARVLICDIQEDLGNALAKELGDENCRFLKTDVADEDAARFAIDTAAEWLGGLDILFNNAGISIPGMVPDISSDVWRRTFAVDVDAVFYFCKFAIPILAADGGGAIVNTASISGLKGDYGLAAYAAAKAAVINLTRAMAVDHARDGVRINAICPGLVETPLTIAAKDAGMWDDWIAGIPMGRAAAPEEIANLALFLSSDESSFMTGSIVVADGGVDASTGQPDIRLLIAAHNKRAAAL